MGIFEQFIKKGWKIDHKIFGYHRENKNSRRTDNTGRHSENNSLSLARRSIMNQKRLLLKKERNRRTHLERLRTITSISEKRNKKLVGRWCEPVHIPKLKCASSAGENLLKIKSTTREDKERKRGSVKILGINLREGD